MMKAAIITVLLLAVWSVQGQEEDPETITRRFQISLRVLSDATPISPLVWATYDTFHNDPILTTTASPGLQSLAENGLTDTLDTELEALEDAGQIKSHGVARQDPHAQSGATTKHGIINFSLTAKIHDYLTFATMFVRSNDRFYAPDRDGIPLFDDDNKPRFGAKPMLYLWDAGTEVNQPYWANLHEGQQSRQPGGGSQGTAAPEGGSILKVADWEFAHNADVLSPLYNNTYPDTATVVELTIERGFDVQLLPNIRGKRENDGVTALVEFTFDTHSDLGNEIHLDFPAGYAFNVDSPTVVQTLSGFATTMGQPTTAVEGNTVQLRWAEGTDLQLSSLTVVFNVSNVAAPNNCDVGAFTLSAMACRINDLHGQGLYMYRDCDTPTIKATSMPPLGVPQDCTTCNACQFLYAKTGGTKVYQCDNDGHRFLRVGGEGFDPSSMCNDNPYMVNGYGA